MQKYVIRTCVIIALLATNTSYGQGCRSLATRISYSYDPTHRFYPNTAVVLNVESTGKSATITISAPRKEKGHIGTQYLLSRDLGSHWTLTREIASPLALPGLSVAEAPSNKRILYKLKANAEGYLRSEDGGQTWHTPKNEIDGVDPRKLALKLGGNGGWRVGISLAAVHPNSPVELFATIRVFRTGGDVSNTPRPINLGLYRSQDGAEHWTSLNHEIDYGTPVGIATSNPTVMFAVSTKGVVVTADRGVTWQKVGHSQELEQIPTIKPSEPDSRMKAIIIPLEVKQIAIHPNSATLVYLVSNKGVYRSNDGGMSWCLLDLGIDFIDSTYSLAFDPLNSSSVFIGTRNGVLYSKDGGDQFETIFPHSR